MLRVRKLMLWLVAGLLGLVLAVYVGINLYLQSPGTTARLEDALGKALRMPVKLTSVEFNFWGGAKLNGVAVPQEGAFGDFLALDSFSARYRIAPLFVRRLELYALSANRPRIIWPQGADKQWHLPRQVAAVKPEQEKKQPKAPADPAATPKPKKSAEQKKSKGFEVKVEDFHIVNASVEMLDVTGERVALIEELNVDFSTLTPELVEGRARLRRLSAGEVAVLENAAASFKTAGKNIELPDLSATFSGGTLSGSYRQQPKQWDHEFTAALKFADVDINRLTLAAGLERGEIVGRASGEVEATGIVRKIKEAQGKGWLEIKDGSVRQMELFQMLGELFQIEELASLRLSGARADFRLGDESVYLDQVALRTPDLALEASGRARFSNKLDLKARLILSKRLSEKLPGIVRDQFTSATADGGRAIEFQIGGRNSRPKSDLDQRLIGKKLLDDQIGKLADKIFGKKDDDKDKSDDKKKKPKEEKKENP